MRLTTQTYSELLAVTDETIRTQFLSKIDYITSKVGSNIAIFNESGTILLM